MNSCAIIIPVHNRRDLTLACLRHLRTVGDLGRFAVVIVDDGCTDGTVDAVRAEFPAVEILRGDGNLWWTGAIALGMKHAFDRDAAAVCWLNDDCLPASGTLGAILEQATSGAGALVAPVCFDAITGAPVPNAFIGRARLETKPGELQRADGLSGFCVAVPRAAWERIGAPDAKHFPHYYGDTAYTLAAGRAGFFSYVLGSAHASVDAYAPPPTVRGLHRKGQGWRKNARQIFVSPKSPYRLGTLFAFQRLKYGAILGTLIAVLRSAGQIARFAVVSAFD